jgi:hypothetical protein
MREAFMRNAEAIRMVEVVEPLRFVDFNMCLKVYIPCSHWTLPYPRMEIAESKFL